MLSMPSRPFNLLWQNSKHHRVRRFGALPLIKANKKAIGYAGFYRKS
jgi:hypothetical protein